MQYVELKNDHLDARLFRVYNVKRLIGRKYSDDKVQQDVSGWQYDVVAGPGDEPRISVLRRGKQKLLSPQQVSAILLSKMKEIAEEFTDEEVTQAVITVPAYFTHHQRSATKEAADIAGLEVLRIINEPMAAALTYGFGSASTRRGSSNSIVLIFDLGGGTCDVCILKVCNENFDVMAVQGDSHLGGRDIDRLLVEHLLEVCYNQDM